MVRKVIRPLPGKVKTIRCRDVLRPFYSDRGSNQRVIYSGILFLLSKNSYIRPRDEAVANRRFQDASVAHHLGFRDPRFPSPP